MERDAVWVKCRGNSGSECQPEEVSYDGKCYKLFVPALEKQNKLIQDLGFSKAEALEHCQKRGGKLLDIGSQVKHLISQHNKFVYNNILNSYIIIFNWILWKILFIYHRHLIVSHYLQLFCTCKIKLLFFF